MAVTDVTLNTCETHCVAKVLRAHTIDLEGSTQNIMDALAALKQDYLCSSRHLPQERWYLSISCAAFVRSLIGRFGPFVAEDFTAEQQMLLEEAGVPIQ